MCFTKEISGIFATIGIIATIISIQKKSNSFIIYLFYTIMELLQTVQHSSLNECNNTNNIFYTKIAFILVMVQPMLWNYHRYMNNKSDVFKFALIASIIWAISFAIRIIPITNDHYIKIDCDNMAVGEIWCTKKNSTDNHLSWYFPLYTYGGLEANYYCMLLLWFLPALWEDKYGIAKCAYWFFQLFVTSLVVNNYHAYPSTWCILSVPIITFMALVDFLE